MVLNDTINHIMGNPKYRMKMLVKSDSQKSKVYRSERRTSYWSNKPTQFNSVEEIQKFVDRMTSYKWFIRRWGMMQIIVLQPGNIRGANGDSRDHIPGMFGYQRTIKLNKGYWHIGPVLHEVAHAINSCDGHSRSYCFRYSQLIYFMVGKEAYQDLKNQFRIHRVKFTLPSLKPKRIVSPQVLEALRRGREKMMENRKKELAVKLEPPQPCECRRLHCEGIYEWCNEKIFWGVGDRGHCICTKESCPDRVNDLTKVRDKELVE